VPRSEALTATARQTIEYELQVLRHHWGDAYSIMTGRDGWQAKRRDGRGDWIIRQTPELLNAAIRADYDAKPVPRG